MIATDLKSIAVDVWVDVVCPFSWIGLTRLHKAIAGFDHADQVAVVHHAYRLMPGAAPESSETVLARKFGSMAQVQPRLDQLTLVAASEGLDYDFSGTVLGDSMDAHRVLKLAATMDLADAVVERVFRGFYSEHASIFDRESLIGLSAEAGLARSDVQATLNSDAYRAEVEADAVRFTDLGGQSTPFFVVGGRALPPGQDTASLSAALEQAWAERTNRTRVTV
jgi:predicted DsbA family dithiol-disulfide isomerase